MGRRCLFNPGWLCFSWWYHSKSTLWGRCFIISTNLAAHLFLLVWLKLNLILLLDLTCYLEDQKQVFSGYTLVPDSKETELGSSDEEASPLAGKNTGIVFVPCHSWKCVPTAISGGVYFWGPWMFVTTDEFSVRVAKITSRIGCINKIRNHIITSCF